MAHRESSWQCKCCLYYKSDSARYENVRPNYQPALEAFPELLWPPELVRDSSRLTRGAGGASGRADARARAGARQRLDRADLPARRRRAAQVLQRRARLDRLALLCQARPPFRFLGPRRHAAWRGMRAGGPAWHDEADSSDVRGARSCLQVPNGDIDGQLLDHDRKAARTAAVGGAPARLGKGGTSGGWGGGASMHAVRVRLNEGWHPALPKAAMLTAARSILPCQRRRVARLRQHARASSVLLQPASPRGLAELHVRGVCRSRDAHPHGAAGTPGV